MTDTLQLSATIKDQNGATMAGRTLSWSSSNPAFATVTGTGLVIGVAAGGATITATVEGKSGTSVLTITDPGPRVTTEGATAASRTIGAEGGSISTVSSAGVNYTLLVPPNALANPQLITMTPITNVRKLPLSAGLAGGVEFKPSGLRFAAAARLRISIPSRPSGNLRLAGLSYEGDGVALSPLPTADSGTVVVMPIEHFSGAVAGFGTQADVSQLLASSNFPSTSSQFYTSSIIQLLNATPPDQNAIISVLRQWFQNVILPQFQNATNDASLVVAVGDYHQWASDVPFLLGIPGADRSPGTYPTELSQIAPVAAQKIGAAIDGNNVTCRSSQSFSALSNVLFWQTQAEFMKIATAAFNLDRASLLSGLCVSIVMEQGTLPNPMNTGTQYSLDVTFGVKFLANGQPQGAPFQVSLTSSNVTFAHPIGASDIAGFYTTVVTPGPTGQVNVAAQGCLIVPGTVVPSDVCGTGAIQSQTVGPLTITTASLPTGSVGASYSQTLQANGGIGNYAWSISSGALPAGLSLDPSTGKISGSPTTNGTFGFTVRVTSGSATISRSMSITVNVAQKFDFTFDHDADGWTLGGLGGHCCQGNWGLAAWDLDVGAMIGKGVIVLDGTGDPGNPNGWISKSFVLPANVTTLQFDVWGHNVAGADARLIVRVVDASGSHKLDDEIIVGGPDNVIQIFTKQINIAAFAGTSVTIFLEQDDNGFMGVFPGQHEQIVLDNIHIRP